MNSIDEIVDRALSSIRKMWFIHALVATPLLWLLLSGWWLLLIPIYLSLTYQAAIHMTASSLINTVPQHLLQAEAHTEAMKAFQEIQRRLDSGEIEPGPELYELMERAGIGLAVVEKTSEQILGRYQDSDIFVWVEMYDPTSKQVERFFFEEIASADEDGVYQVPHYEGKLSAVVNGLVYTRPLQPAQG